MGLLSFFLGTLPPGDAEPDRRPKGAVAGPGPAERTVSQVIRAADLETEESIRRRRASEAGRRSTVREATELLRSRELAAALREDEP